MKEVIRDGLRSLGCGGCGTSILASYGDPAFHVWTKNEAGQWYCPGCSKRRGLQGGGMNDVKRAQWEMVIERASEAQLQYRLMVDKDLLLAVNAELTDLKKGWEESDRLRRSTLAREATLERERNEARARVAELEQAGRRMLDNFSPHPGPDTERWREEHEACEWMRTAINEVEKKAS